MVENVGWRRQNFFDPGTPVEWVGQDIAIFRGSEGVPPAEVKKFCLCKGYFSQRIRDFGVKKP